MQTSVPAAVTVVIPAYKASATLNRTLSALAFSKPAPTDVIVVLDGPADPKTEAVLLDWPNARVIRLGDNQGACAARNAGLQEVDTPYVMFLDADDSLSPGLIGALADEAETTQSDLVLAPYARETSAGSLEMVHSKKPIKSDDLANFWLSGSFVPPCAVLWRTSFVRGLDGWDESLSQNQDGDLVYRALFAGASVAWAKSGYGIYVQGPAQGRVSRALSASTILSQFKVLERVEQLNTTSHLIPEASIGRAWYNLARRLYGRGATSHANQALARARQLGFLGHDGNFVDQIAAQAFGLDGKIRIMQSLRNTLQTLGQAASGLVINKEV
jgi:glycosyltransferase involved in cell wall biosynthesis